MTSFFVAIPILDSLRGQASAGGFEVIEDLGCYVSNIVALALMVAGVAAFVYLVWGGISWITAGSDQAKVDEARSRLTNAVLGLGIVAAAWAVFSALDYFFGLNLVGGSC
jgi:hypothetical protein